MDLIYIKRKYRNRAILIISIFILVTILVILVLINYITKVTSINRCYMEYETQISTIQNLVKPKVEKDNTIKVIAERKDEELPNLTEKGLENIYNIYKSEKKRVFLTFDDGPSKTVTIPILDLLKQENIKATFFVLGSRVELYPSIVKRAYYEGHFIANHGYSHEYSRIYSYPQSVLDEYNKTNKAIRKAIGKKEYNSHLFRFPGGSTGGKYKDVKKAAINKLQENNIAYVDWNALTGDSEGGKRTPEQLIMQLQETVGQKNSIVVLMHDAGNKQTTYEALPQVISFFRENGYEFKSFYEIIK